MNNELFVIDLTGCTNTGEIITSVSAAFEVPDSRERKIGLKLNDITLNQAQILSIQSLIASYASELDFVETLNESTKNICENMGIRVQTPQYVEKHETNYEQIGFEIAPKDDNSNAQSDFGVQPQELKGNGLLSDIADMGGNNISDSSGNGFEEFQPIEFNEDGKQTMETYKKAYDEDEEDKQTWEEVDYYAPPTDEPVVVDSKQTIAVNQAFRSGQVL